MQERERVCWILMCSLQCGSYHCTFDRHRRGGLTFTSDPGAEPNLAQRLQSLEGHYPLGVEMVGPREGETDFPASSPDPAFESGSQPRAVQQPENTHSSLSPHSPCEYP